MNTLFSTIGRVAVRRRRGVLAVWALLLLLGALFAPRLHEVFERQFVTGNTGDSQAAADAISREFPTGSAYQEQLVLTSPAVRVSDPRYRRAAAAVIAAAEATGRVKSAESYYSTGDPSLVSRDGRTTYVLLNLRSTTHSDGMVSSGKLLERVAAAPKPRWLRAYVTGTEATHADAMGEARTSLTQAELIGLPIAMLVLIAVFGALVAAALPLVVGLVAIALALALAFAVGQLMNLSVYLENFTTMLGLGVGIDYSLFILSRHRSERRAGRSVDEALVEAVTHAGKAIAFSGVAVVVGLAALLVTPDPTVVSMAVGGILVVPVAVAATLTLLPATVSFLGDRIEAPRALARLLRRPGGGFWRAWAARVMRRPVLLAAVTVGAVAALAWPTVGLSTGTFGVKVLSANAQSRRGYEVLAHQFGAGELAPVNIVVRARGGIDRPASIAGIYRLTRRIERDPRFAGAVSLTTLAPKLGLARQERLFADGFARVPAGLRPSLERVVDVDRGGDTTIVRALLPSDPSSKASEAAVKALRDRIIPSIPELRGDAVFVGGATAQSIDTIAALYGRFPLVIGLVLGVTFLLLVVLLRSLLIPLAAVVTNLFSVLAAYGLLVLVFQDGYGRHLLNFHPAGSISWITPVLLFGVLFGLSMDYQVFLLSRMRELRDRGHSHEEAVALGLERTAAVISGAAAIMIVIFGAFAISPLLPLKELGFGLAVAVLLDATLIRLIAVPAVLRLFGERSWWLPPRLRRALPS